MKLSSGNYAQYLLLIGLVAVLSMAFLYSHTKTAVKHIHPFHVASVERLESKSMAAKEALDYSSNKLHLTLQAEVKSKSPITNEVKTISTIITTTQNSIIQNTNENTLKNKSSHINVNVASRSSESHMISMILDDTLKDEKKKNLLPQIFMDFHYTSNQFSFINYKSIESIISLYNERGREKDKPFIEVILLAPHSANYYKVGTLISKHYFEKYLKYGFEVKVIVIYEEHIFLRRLPRLIKNKLVELHNKRIGKSNRQAIYSDSLPAREQIGLGLSFFEREMKRCCSLKLIQEINDFRFHPIYLLFHSRLLNLYLYGGYYFDFTWIQLARLDEYPSFANMDEAALVVGYCLDSPLIGHMEERQLREHRVSQNANDVIRDQFNLYCHSTSVLVFKRPFSSVLRCVLDMYEDESSTFFSCISAVRSTFYDHIILGNICMQSAFDECFHQVDKVNEFDSQSFDLNTHQPCYSHGGETADLDELKNKEYLHQKLTNRSRYKADTSPEYILEHRDSDWSLNYYCSYPSSVVPWLSSFTNFGNSINSIARNKSSINDPKYNFIYDDHNEIVSLFRDLKNEIHYAWKTSSPSTNTTSLSASLPVADNLKSSATTTGSNSGSTLKTSDQSGISTGSSLSQRFPALTAEWLGPMALSDSWILPTEGSMLHNLIQDNNKVIRKGLNWTYRCNHYYNPFSSRQADASCSPYFVIPGFMKAGSTFLYDLILTNVNNHIQLSSDRINRENEVRALHNLRGGSFKETGCYELPASLLNSISNNASLSNFFIDPEASLGDINYMKNPTLNSFQRRMNCFPFVEEGEPFIFGDATVYNLVRPGSPKFIALDAIKYNWKTSSGSSNANSIDANTVFVPVVIAVRNPVRRLLSHFKFTKGMEKNGPQPNINEILYNALRNRNGGLWTMHYITKHALDLLDLLKSGNTSPEDRIAILEGYLSTIELLKQTYYNMAQLSRAWKDRLYVDMVGSDPAVDEGRYRYKYHHVNNRSVDLEEINYDSTKELRYAYSLLHGSIYVPSILYFSSVLDSYAKENSEKLNKNIYVVCIERLNFKSDNTQTGQQKQAQLDGVLAELNSLFSFMKIAFNKEVKPVSFFETLMKTKLNLTLDEFTVSNLQELYSPFNQLLDYYIGDHRKCSY